MINMFKSSRVYQLSIPADVVLDDSLFEPAKFCSIARQALNYGFVPPRGEEHGALVEVVDGHYLMLMAFESRSVPTSAVRDAVATAAQTVFENTGRMPGKKERRALAQDAYFALLPQAFPRTTYVGVWVNRARTRLYLDTVVQSRADTVITELVKAIPGLVVTDWSLPISPSSLMTQWLVARDSVPHSFEVGTECELKSHDENKTLIRYSRYNFEFAEIAHHVAEGRLPSQLRIIYDDQVAFNLHASGVLSKVKYSVPEGHDSSDFDSNMALMIGSLESLVDDLSAAMADKKEAQDE